MNTNVTGFRWFLKIFASYVLIKAVILDFFLNLCFLLLSICVLVLSTKVALALEGLSKLIGVKIS